MFADYYLKIFVESKGRLVPPRLNPAWKIQPHKHDEGQDAEETQLAEVSVKLSCTGFWLLHNALVLHDENADYVVRDTGASPTSSGDK